MVGLRENKEEMNCVGGRLGADGVGVEVCFEPSVLRFLIGGAASACGVSIVDSGARAFRLTDCFAFTLFDTLA